MGSATVCVTLKVEVTVGSWSDKSTFAELKSQVIREAKQKLANVVSNKHDLQIVGDVVAVRVIMNGEG